ncbi:hypothetical protein SAMN05892883_1097 [Jatrophihabitans sp. GAS493]|uniref:hypothetical protein n=1 Tax=Jatrophihabitans sp. GAS493 TaxID=1907575 RepID=UPI000BB6F518|nr:hypothetical protein [Jatrophihabitans sp. GAS493]SOD71598.1 hypothetical protein SAMN05892883_1097 [Jatrophihabitans sp. GAS493]
MNYALDTSQAQKLGIGVIVGVILLGLLLSFVVTAVVGRIIILALVVGAGLFIWHQREDIAAAARKCDATFLGVHLTPTDPQIKAQCVKVANP